MSNRIVAALSAVLVLSSCAHEISNEERLDRDTRKTDASKTETAEDLLKLKCDDISSELVRAKDESAPEDKRLATYVDLYEKVKNRTQRFDEAISRNPDLAYQEGSDQITSAREGCIQSQVDVRYDFERLVREICALPVVDDIRDGKPVKAARIDFDSLREAIDKLDPDDKESLLTRLANAEKTVEVKSTKRKRDK